MSANSGMVGLRPHGGMVGRRPDSGMVTTCGILCVVRGVLRGLLIVPALVFWATGCTGDDHDTGGDDLIVEMTEPSPVYPMNVSGVLVVQSVHAIRHPGGRCLMEGELRRLIGPTKAPVVIKAPDGQVARAEIVEAAATDAPGVCNFPFHAWPVPDLEGEYTASIPELDVKVRFESADASGVVLHYVE